MDLAIKPSDLVADDTFAPTPLPKIRGYFLGKRVPMILLKRAKGLPGKSMAVYMGLWVRFSIEKKREIELERKFFNGSGMAPTSITRGIDELVKAGLIQAIILQLQPPAALLQECAG